LEDAAAVGDVLGYARVSTRDQKSPAQTMRREEAGAIKVFTDVRSGKSMDRPGLAGELIFHVFGAIAHFERRLIVECTKDGIAAERERGERPTRRPLDPDMVQAALKLVEAGLSPTKVASQLGLGWSTVYREVAAANINRNA
jgi:DNA invertase Pin-like site-specific DNA recombinase